MSEVFENDIPQGPVAFDQRVRLLQIVRADRAHMLPRRANSSSHAVIQVSGNAAASAAETDMCRWPAIRSSSNP